MAKYKFKDGLYANDITYRGPEYVFAFLKTKEQMNEFFKLLFKRIKESNELREKTTTVSSEKIPCHAIENDNDNVSLIDIDYNFFIVVLAEWISHYASNTTVESKYTIYTNISVEKENPEDENEEQKTIRKYRDYEMDFSVSQRVQFDFSYSGRLIHEYVKKFERYTLVQVLLNNVLGKHTYVKMYNYRSRAIPVSSIFAKDLRYNDHIRLATISFHRDILKKYITKKNLDYLKKIAKEYEVISNTNATTKKAISKLELADEDIRFSNIFDIIKLEKKMDKGDGKLHVFVEKKEDKNEENSEGETEA